MNSMPKVALLQITSIHCRTQFLILIQLWLSSTYTSVYSYSAYAARRTSTSSRTGFICRGGCQTYGQKESTRQSKLFEITYRYSLNIIIKYACVCFS